MRRLVFAITILLACALSAYHFGHGVSTDEAKYLLGIPYPHPPLFQFLFSSIDGWVFQEQFLRFSVAFALLSGCWIIWLLTPSLILKLRLFFVFGYLTMPAVLLQSGSVLMASITSVQFLLFLYLYTLSSRDERTHWITFATSVLWLITLSTSLQGILIAPLVFAILYRSMGFWRGMFMFLLPLLVFVMMVVSNPLSLGSFAVHPGRMLTTNWQIFFSGELFVLFFAGGLLTIFGALGLLLQRQIPVLLSFALLCGYIATSPQIYYAILFVPFLIVGCIAMLPYVQYHLPLLSTFTLSTVLLMLYVHQPLSPSNDVRSILSSLPSSLRMSTGTLVIAGSFGHEWQYESPLPVRRYSKYAAQDAVAIVCTVRLSCPSEVRTNVAWKEVPETALPLYVRATYIP